MIVKINHNKLNDAPYNKLMEDSFVSNHSEEVDQLKQELINGTPTCYLVSGYRGSGKTSLIRKIETELPENICFVYTNFSKYESHEIILRKIIRAIYLSLFTQKDKLIDTSIVTKLEKLYVRTFYDVKNSNSSTSSSSIKHTFIIDFDIINIVLLIFITIGGLNLKYSFLQKFISSFLEITIFLFSLFLFITKNIDFSSIFERFKKNEESSSITELYDNDIAEYQLMSVLKNSRDTGINITIVIDELDKIENINETISIINELKPLMLSGLCNFILIAGQRFFYNLGKSQISDDNSLFSMFSKIVHTKLFLKDDFVELFKFYLKNTDDANKVIVTKYLDSLILQSNNLPRKFINLIRQKLIWKENEASIEINESELSGFETDSILLDIIDKIKSNTVDLLHVTAAIKDFFLVQLHLIVHKIKIKKTSFTIEDIFDSEDYNSSIYPVEIVFELNSLTTMLLEELCDKNLLEKINEIIDRETIIRYKWIAEIAINETNDIDFNESIKSKFVTTFIEFEKSIRDISVDLFNNNLVRNNKNNIKEMYNTLIINEVLTSKYINKLELDKIINIRNNLVHGNYELISDENQIKNYQITLTRLQYYLYEDYTFYVTKNYLQNLNFKIERTQNGPFDFLAKPLPQGIEIKFEVKKGRMNHSQIVSLANQILNDQMSNSNIDSYYVIFYYESNGRKNYELLVNKFNNLLLKEKLKDKVFLFFTSEYRSDFNSGRIHAYIEKVLDTINYSKK